MLVETLLPEVEIWQGSFLSLYVSNSGASEDHPSVLPDSHIHYIYIVFLYVLTSGV
jgi:hypothetical protein